MWEGLVGEEVCCLRAAIESFINYSIVITTMVKSVYGLLLKDVLKHDPLKFDLCRITDKFHGSWDVSPVQAIILADLGHDGPSSMRCLTDAEAMIMKSCPDGCWYRPTDSDDYAIALATGSSTKYDLLAS